MHHSVIWTSEDGQADMDMSGNYTCGEGRRVSISAVKCMVVNELLGQCSDVVEHDNILAGTIIVDSSEPMACR